MNISVCSLDVVDRLGQTFQAGMVHRICGEDQAWRLGTVHLGLTRLSLNMYVQPKIGLEIEEGASRLESDGMIRPDHTGWVDLVTGSQLTNQSQAATQSSVICSCNRLSNLS